MKTSGNSAHFGGGTWAWPLVSTAPASVSMGKPPSSRSWSAELLTGMGRVLGVSESVGALSIIAFSFAFTFEGIVLVQE